VKVAGGDEVLASPGSVPVGPLPFFLAPSIPAQSECNLKSWPEAGGRRRSGGAATEPLAGARARPRLSAPPSSSFRATPFAPKPEAQRPVVAMTHRAVGRCISPRAGKKKNGSAICLSACVAVMEEPW
jgi:hypothetical protein